MPNSNDAKANAWRTDRPADVHRGARPRPPLFRALGADEPPEHVEIEGASYRFVKVFKHDSWAATALYKGDGGEVVCKFNRRQPVGFVPMRWLGRWLARNERTIMQRLDDVPNVPRWSGAVNHNGQVLLNVVAHEFIPGVPLGRRTPVADHFFPALRTLLLEMHQRGIAYVDLHKVENVLVGDDGLPYLFDFQISFAPSERWRNRSRVVRTILRLFQQSDDYHLLKMQAKLRPDLYDLGPDGIASQRPWWISAHRLVARPFRALRRRLLVTFGIRRGQGRATSEHFAEEAMRLESETKR